MTTSVPLRALAAALLVLPLAAPAVAGQTADRVDVLIQFESRPSRPDIAAVRDAGGQVTRRFSIVPAVAATVPVVALAALRANPRVRLVEPDSLVYAEEYRSTHDWGIAHVNADDVHRGATPNLGAGVTVAILDSGIDCGHLELPNVRCDNGDTWGENFVAASTFEHVDEADDDYGHGTHVAGTVAASLHGVAGGVVGVAPDARLVALKTLDADGVGAWSRHIAAIDHVWNFGQPVVDIVNMSIGRGDYSSVADAAMQRAYESGILLVAAAGNGGTCSGKGSNVSYPALFESVIAVAAVDSANARPCWSATGAKVELTAPGVSVFSSWPSDMSTSPRDPQPVCDDGDGDGSRDDCHYKHGSGTSMSAPHVAGAAALVLASGITDEDAAYGRANEVRGRLAETAIDLGSAGRDPQHGYGLIDVAAATRTGEVAPDPEGNVHVGDLNGAASVKGKSTKWEATVTVTVHDAADTPFANATVTGSWSGARTGTATGTTSSGGTVTFLTGSMSSGTSVTFEVTGVSSGTTTYDPGANHDDDGTSDGTRITLRRT